MAQQALDQFRSLLALDPALQSVVRQAVQVGSAQGVLAAAADRGLPITEAELADALADGELSDLELELVAGGSKSNATYHDGK
jgi:predicted ribosomally synthesized peptide with nif11-like leader